MSFIINMDKDDRNRIFRTVLFVPGHIDKMLRKAAGTEADCIVLDCEDAVPISKKEEAGMKIREALDSGLFANKTVFVRLNPPQSGLTVHDLEITACERISGFIYPHVSKAEEIRAFEEQLDLIEKRLNLKNGSFNIIPLIENPSAVLNACTIAAASRRVIALLFGCEDYLAGVQGRHSADNIEMLFARTIIVLAARAAGIEPIDGPYVDLDNTAGLRRFAEQGRDLGMSGMLVVSPRQIPIVKEIYTPNEEEVRRAKEIIKSAEEADRQGVGITYNASTFVSPPTVRAAKKLLIRNDAIKKRELKG